MLVVSAAAEFAAAVSYGILNFNMHNLTVIMYLVIDEAL